jgi:hypothetical protein
MRNAALVRIQFRFEAAFNHGFGQFFEQAPFTQDILGLVVIFQQFIYQFASNRHGFLRIHYFSVFRILPLTLTIVQSP